MRTFDEAAPYWRYTEPAPKNTKLALLTHDNQMLTGPWKGPDLDGRPAEPGQRRATHYKAWAGLLKRDKELERQLGYL